MPKKKPKDGSPVRPKKKADKTIKEAVKPTKTKTGKKGAELTLTNDLAQHMAVMWTHNLTDEVIYTSLGIPHKTFYVKKMKLIN